jgi:type IV pilus assembly protein PilA
MNKAFTLLELVVVMVILGILISLGIPQYSITVEKSRAAEGVGFLGALRGAQLRYYAEHGSYVINCECFPGITCGLDLNFPTPRFFVAPTISINTPAPPFGLGYIYRNDTNNPGFGPYVLIIDEAGTITCRGGAAGSCEKLGFQRTD